MGFLDRVLGTSGVKENWKQLQSMADLDGAQELSFQKPVVLFKDSTTCGISAYAKQKLTGLEITDRFEFFYLDLLAHRDISNEIAHRFGVIHQSPQIIVLKDSRSVFDTSHHAISSEVVLKQLQ